MAQQGLEGVSAGRIEVLATRNIIVTVDIVLYVTVIESGGR